MAEQLKTVKIGDVELANRYGLAPYEGYYDLAFRWISYQYGAALGFTEPMVAEDFLSMTRKAGNVAAYLGYDEKKPGQALALTLEYREDDNLLKAIPLLQQNFDSYDLLYVKLRGDADIAFLSALVTDSVKPVIVSYSETDPSFLNKLKIAGIPGFVLENQNLIELSEIRKKTDLLILANGDYSTVNDLFSSGADIVLFKEKTLGQPALFKELTDEEEGIHHIRNGLIRQGEDLRKYIDREFAVDRQGHALEYAKRMFPHFVKNFVNTMDVSEKIKTLKSKEELVEVACELEYK